MALALKTATKLKTPTQENKGSACSELLQRPLSSLKYLLPFSATFVHTVVSNPNLAFFSSLWFSITDTVSHHQMEGGEEGSHTSPRGIHSAAGKESSQQEVLCMPCVWQPLNQYPGPSTLFLSHNTNPPNPCLS